jgi:hypothetical protein
MDLKHLKIKQIAKLEPGASYAVKFNGEPMADTISKLRDLFEGIAKTFGTRFIIFGDYLEFPIMVPNDLETIVEKLLIKHKVIKDDKDSMV